ncbi:zf-HC2 domain-containing protein [Amycolatopsis balhimycina DSM 5908]|uniref:Zf-HC2 domain-containing protein n=1 Tax=Amycolatopsis balhimycina DSM 5908 TaxID=1081091 RepID=A0A428W4L2_AMYBA|nr:zf-HC2 domain-containing protein [Amycolatopsis balhimycina]RSM38010.1 zf-HC2 domain-containing protein [Amycolatopsis balhimycina DSM 5908]
MAGSAHTDVAAYVLGVLSEAENAQFEAHLMNCPHCQLDLIELYQLPDVLDLVKRSWPEPPMPAPSPRTLSPGPRVLRGLMEEAAVKRRRRKRVGLLAGAAAAAAVIAGPLVTLAVRPADAVPPAALASPSGKQPPPVSSVPATSTAPPSAGAPAQPGGGQTYGRGSGGSAVSAVVTVSPVEWGSRVDLELRGIVGPVKCQLVAVSTAGDERVVSSWAVPPKGFGIPGSPEPLRLQGSISLAMDQIGRFEVRGDDGSVLVVVQR